MHSDIFRHLMVKKKCLAIGIPLSTSIRITCKPRSLNIRDQTDDSRKNILYFTHSNLTNMASSFLPGMYSRVGNGK